jgi:hypothetical protein
MDRQPLIEECKRKYESGETVSALIKFLRDSGCYKIDSIAVIISACGLDLAEAKKAVHFDPSWDDTRAADDQFHEMAAEAIFGEESKD